MDFWARGAFHRGRRLAKADATPNVIRKAVRKNLRGRNADTHNRLSGDDEYFQTPTVSIGPRKGSA